MGFIAGPFTATFAGAALGETENDSIRVRWSFHWEPVTGDSMGDSVQDLVYRGASAHADMVLEQFDAAGVQNAFWPYVTGVGLTDWGAHGQVGRIHLTSGSELAQALVLTAVAGTPAAGDPATLTAARAILAPGFEVHMIFQPRLRKVPLSFLFLPVAGVLFSVT